MKKFLNKLFKKQENPNLIDFPTTVVLDTVNLCNLKCAMCFREKMTGKKGFMDEKLFKKAIDEIAEVNKNTRLWLVFSGEPLVRSKYKPSIFDLIKYAKSKGMTNTAINTNGSLMNEENARKIIESGLDEITFGIDSLDPEKYANIRRGSQLDNVINNVNRLIELKKEINASNPKIMIQFIEMDENQDELEQFKSFWSDKDVYVKTEKKITWGNKVKPATSQKMLERASCSWGMTTMIISLTGDVLYCAIDLDSTMYMGNITNRTLRNVWNDKLKKYRIAQLEKKWHLLPETCQNCTDWQGTDVVVHTQSESSRN